MALCNTFARQRRFSTYEGTITTEISKLTFGIAAMSAAEVVGQYRRIAPYSAR
jgi:hypothetical protein